MLELSVVIPAYNEEHRLPATLESVHDFLRESGKSFELIVVDDGSLDATAQVVETFAETHNSVRLLSYQPNRGKGHAVRIGMLAAQGDLLLMNDADGSSPIAEIQRLIAGITGGADLAIGSRAKPDDTREVKALLHRKFIGNTFNAIVKTLLLPGIYDTQCGFKLFRREAARDVFSVQRTNGYGFDVEILYVAKLHGYRLVEIPINWANVEGSKVNVLLDSPKMFVEVVRICVSGWLGHYKRLPTSVRDGVSSRNAVGKEMDNGS
jgi:dolichyl-phosphate beta-glucosyltransferase